jgi:acyl CoA:acetate/3-ketoacid CoA transferase alpha subunit
MNFKSLGNFLSIIFCFFGIFLIYKIYKEAVNEIIYRENLIIQKTTLNKLNKKKKIKMYHFSYLFQKYEALIGIYNFSKTIQNFDLKLIQEDLKNIRNLR